MSKEQYINRFVGEKLIEFILFLESEGVDLTIDGENIKYKDLSKFKNKFLSKNRQN